MKRLYLLLICASVFIPNPGFGQGPGGPNAPNPVKCPPVASGAPGGTGASNQLGCERFLHVRNKTNKNMPFSFFETSTDKRCFPQEQISPGQIRRYRLCSGETTLK